MMTLQEKQELRRLLEKFFAEAKFGTRDFLSKGLVMPYLKKQLVKAGHWRDKARNKTAVATDSRMVAAQFIKKHKSDIRNYPPEKKKEKPFVPPDPNCPF